jgi:hypothetical protein
LSLLVNEQVTWQKSKRQGLPAWYLANVTLPADSNIRVCTFIMIDSGRYHVVCT